MKSIIYLQESGIIAVLSTSTVMSVSELKDFAAGKDFADLPWCIVNSDALPFDHNQESWTLPLELFNGDFVSDNDLHFTFDNDSIQKSKDELLREIIVTVSTGKVFDGDELSQTRMARALQIASFAGQSSTPWKLQDNTVEDVTIAELQEALALAMVRVGEIVGAIDAGVS